MARPAMSETVWDGGTDDRGMLRYLVVDLKVHDTASGHRRVRLFLCAAARKVWHLLEDEASRRAVEAAESFADGSGEDQEREEAWSAAAEVSDSAPYGLEYKAPRWRAALIAEYAASEDLGDALCVCTQLEALNGGAQ